MASPDSLSTILDFGATSHLIRDRGYFVDFATEDHLPVKTVNQGMLSMLGRGTCIVKLKLGKNTHRIVLKDCLHTPSALLNLLSVGHMLLQGWGCDFRGTTSSSGPSCQLSY